MSKKTMRINDNTLVKYFLYSKVAKKKYIIRVSI